MSLKLIDTLWNFENSVKATASSEAVGHPASNQLLVTRSKVWRSNGLFLVTLGVNDSIDFDDGGGEFNAILTPGKYLVTELITEIKTQMEALGGQIYTISFSAGTGLWSISSDGGTFNLLWSSGTNSSDSIGSSLGFDVSSDDTASTSYIAAAIALHTEEYVTLDLGTWGTNSVDSVAVFFDPERGPQYTPLGTLRLQASQTLAFAAPSVDLALTIDEDFSVITHFFATSQNYRYWRLKIVDPGNPDLFVEVPKFIVGQNSSLSQGPEIGFRERVRDRTKKQVNDFGNEFFDTLPNQRFEEFTWKHLTEDDKILLKQLYLAHGMSKPVMIVIDPTEAVFQNKDESTLYGRLDNDFEASQTFSSFFDFAMTLREVF